MRILEEALTFDDVLLVPAYSEILPREVDLSTRVTRRIRVNVPLMSAAMDTVTEARLAITIAQEGGIGVIHKSMTIEAQALEVGRVKKFESISAKNLERIVVFIGDEHLVERRDECYSLRRLEAGDAARPFPRLQVHYF